MIRMKMMIGCGSATDSTKSQRPLPPLHQVVLFDRQHPS